MKARLRQLAGDLAETFWLLPATMVAAGLMLALALVRLDATGAAPRWVVHSPWLYGGGGTGARTLLGAVASSMISVAGTVFSITIAALTLAAGQMGPRLLRNFTRDRGNQFALGMLLATFTYALVVLRSVRTVGEGDFVPRLAMTVGMLMAIASVGTLVWFVGHIAGRINVDTVVELVSNDLDEAIGRLTLREPPPAPPPPWIGAAAVTDARRGYLQHFDAEGLAAWAAARGVRVRMKVRPGDYVFPGMAVAELSAGEEAQAAGVAVTRAMALGPSRVGASDLEYAVRQLVEVAVRALSPGINDPNTAIAVLDRLGAALCAMVSLHLPSGVWEIDGAAVLTAPSVTYDGLVDGMLHTIRQNAAGSLSVRIRMMEVLAAVAACERRPARLATLSRHAGLIAADLERSDANPDDVADARRRTHDFEVVRDGRGRMG